MNRFFGLFCVMVLQGCYTGNVSALDTIPESPSEAINVVIRNGSNREIFNGTVPLIVVLKSQIGLYTYPYAIQVEMVSQGGTRGFVLNFDRVAWTVMNGEDVVEHILPNKVLLLSSHGSMSSVSSDEWNSTLAYQRLKASLGQDDLTIILTNEALFKKVALTTP